MKVGPRLRENSTSLSGNSAMMSLLRLFSYAYNFHIIHTYIYTYIHTVFEQLKMLCFGGVHPFLMLKAFFCLCH
jgi:hypothetical protein